METGPNLNPGPPRYVKVPEIAARLGVSRMTVYRMVRRGQLPALRFGKNFRIEAAAVDEYIAMAEQWAQAG